MGMYCTMYSMNPEEMQHLLIEPKTIHDLDSMKRRTTLRLSLEKAWHGLHFLLTGSAWGGEEPLCFLTQGGDKIGDVDLGYGPARVFGPDAVQRLDAALSDVSEDGLWSRFDPARMEQEGVYPGIWDEPEEDLREEYLEYFRELKAFVRQVNQGHMALIVALG